MLSMKTEQFLVLPEYNGTLNNIKLAAHSVNNQCAVVNHQCVIRWAVLAYRVIVAYKHVRGWPYRLYIRGYVCVLSYSMFYYPGLQTLTQQSVWYTLEDRHQTDPLFHICTINCSISVHSPTALPKFFFLFFYLFIPYC